MRTIIITALIGLIASLVCSRPARSESDAGGIPLLRKDMKGWSRGGTDKNQWKMLPGDTLISEAGNDSYAWEELLEDGTLHLEWRFTPTADNAKKAVVGSVTVRGSGDEQCKIALGTGCGTITTTVVSSSDRAKPFLTKARGAKPNPVGEWNTLTIKQDGRSVSVSVNGASVASTTNAPPSGVFAVNAEGDPIEFRNIRWHATR